MKDFFFGVKGRPLFVCKADTLLNAMKKANEHFGALRMGMWAERSVRTFLWVEGNFFD